MALCARVISEDQPYDCNVSGGVENIYYVFNRIDIVAYARSVGNTQIITDFTLAGAAVGYQFEGYNNSTKPKSVLVRKTYSAKYDQTIDAVIFSRGSVTKDQLEALALDEVVVIIENKYKGSDATFEIYGLDIGLQLKALTDDPTNADSEGAYVVQWGSPDNFKEPHLPATFFITDYADTKAAIVALLA